MLTADHRTERSFLEIVLPSTRVATAGTSPSEDRFLFYNVPWEWAETSAECRCVALEYRFLFYDVPWELGGDEPCVCDSPEALYGRALFSILEQILTKPNVDIIFHNLISSFKMDE